MGRIMTNPNDMSLVEHLVELRSRLIRYFIFAGIVLIACLPFADQIYAYVASPLTNLLPATSSMIATEVTTPFVAPLKLTIYTALIFSMPYFLVELWGFVSPGLYKNEKSFVVPLLVSSSVLFYLGIAFAYFIVSPIILNFFILSAPDSIQVMTDISKYLDFMLKLFFAFGLAFEIPVATILVVNTGLADKQSIKKIRPYIVIGFFVLAMLLTPPDIFSQLFLALPMWLLFELGLLLARDKKI